MTIFSRNSVNVSFWAEFFSDEEFNSILRDRSFLAMQNARPDLFATFVMKLAQQNISGKGVNVLNTNDLMTQLGLAEVNDDGELDLTKWDQDTGLFVSALDAWLATIVFQKVDGHRAVDIWHSRIEAYLDNDVYIAESLRETCRVSDFAELLYQKTLTHPANSAVSFKRV